MKNEWNTFISLFFSFLSLENINHSFRWNITTNQLSNLRFRKFVLTLRWNSQLTLMTLVYSTIALVYAWKGKIFTFTRTELPFWSNINILLPWRNFLSKSKFNLSIFLKLILLSNHTLQRFPNINQIFQMWEHNRLSQLNANLIDFLFIPKK